jgi:2-polyprenyl-3-methyl-5-hydroxy-6-metoxy-1,4-benzoquinol methylase
MVQNIKNKDLYRAMRAAYEEAGPVLSKELIDEMAAPSYLQGCGLTRYFAWGKLTRILRVADLKPETTVFDFGCGTGVLLPQLCREGRTVYATDLHLEIAKNVAVRLGLKRITFIETDLWRDAIPDGEIDTIIAANVMEHITSRGVVLAALARKLTPAGKLVISGPTENFVYHVGRRIAGFTGDYHVATILDVFSDTQAAGLKAINNVAWPLPGPLCLYRIAAFTRR